MFQMDKKMKIICLILIIAIVMSSIALVGVLVAKNSKGNTTTTTTTTTTTNNGGTPNTPSGDGKVTVTWRYGAKILKEDKIDAGSKVTSWTPTSDGKEFLGWFSNPGLTTEFDFTKPINTNTTIYASFKTVGTPDEPVTPDFYLAGTGRGSLASITPWSPSDMTLGMQEEGSGKYAITVDLYAGDVFQILHGGSWDGQMGIDKFAGVITNDSGALEVKDDDGNVVFYGSGMNGIDITLAEGRDGQYTIYLDSVDGVITFKFIKALDPNDIPEPPVVDKTYTVAGNSGLCGTEWSCDDTANDMTLDEASGLYIITYTNIYAGTYQFKICESHSWSVCYGDPNNSADNNNFNITVEEDGTTVIITFDPATKTITVLDGKGNSIAGGTPSTPPVTGNSDIIFIGTMNGWDTTSSSADWGLTLGADGKTWTGTLVVTEDMYADWTVAELGQLCAAVKLYNKTTGQWIAYEGESNLALTVGTYHFKYIDGSANFAYWADGEKEPDAPSTPSTPTVPDGTTIYTIVGQEGLCGSDWNTTDTSNDMMYQSTSGAYSLTFTNVAAGTYEFKIVKNYAWGDGQYPADNTNVSVTVTSDGSYVSIEWNPATSKLTVTVIDASGTPVVPETPEDAKIIFVGSMNEWNTATTDAQWQLTQDSDGKTWTGTITVTEETQVKLFDQSKIYGHDQGWLDPAAGTGENGNAVLSAGTYHFKYVEGDVNFTYWADGGEEPETPETPEDSKIIFVGDFNTWGEVSDYEEWLLTQDSDGKTWTGTFTVTEETQLKLFDKSGLCGEWGGWIAPPAGTGENGNAVLTAGTYHFKYVEGEANFTYWADGEEEPETPETPEGTAIKVYVDNTAGWSTVNCYYWNDSGNNGWPGATMTYDAAEDLWYYEIPAGYTNVIFNDGSAQTSDLTVPTDDKVVYNNAAYSWAEKGATVEIPDPTRVYVNNTAGWESVYCYFWGGNSNSWPGDAMTYDADLQLYYFDIPAGTQNCIFNNGSSQTDDLVVPTGNAVVFDNTTCEWGTLN